jgi:hypothetical protein
MAVEKEEGINEINDDKEKHHFILIVSFSNDVH